MANSSLTNDVGTVKVPTYEKGSLQTGALHLHESPQLVIAKHSLFINPIKMGLVKKRTVSVGAQITVSGDYP